MKREIKFRAWDDEKIIQLGDLSLRGLHHWNNFDLNNDEDFAISVHPEAPVMQYTGLKDKNGVEIYEFMEIDNKYRVIYNVPKYVLQDISNGDIIDIYDKPTITSEYSPI